MITEPRSAPIFIIKTETIFTSTFRAGAMLTPFGYFYAKTLKNELPFTDRLLANF